jgi:hypothetical protein
LPELIEDGNDQRARGRFKNRDQDHRN